MKKQAGSLYVIFSALLFGMMPLLAKIAYAQSGWAAEAAMALFTTVFALVLFQKGLFLCGEVRASLLSTFEPLAGIVIGVIVFHETLGYKEITGIIGILLAAVLLVMPSKQDAKKNG